ncbi:hypothetical protein BKA82DRAFT_4178782, partial [Pisolithus tinctorius]
TLPHLAFVLHRLLLITRRMRLQLGAKQSKLVAGTLPPWISPSQPLGIADSRALRRVLTHSLSKVSRVCIKHSTAHRNCRRNTKS